MGLIYSRLTVTEPMIVHGGCPNLIQVAPKSGLTIVDIQRAVSTYFGLPFDEMKSARRARDVARPRQIAMFLAKEFTPRSLPEIGRRFGGRDHTTVIHAIRRIKELIETNADLASDVTKLRGEIERLV